MRLKEILADLLQRAPPGRGLRPYDHLGSKETLHFPTERFPKQPLHLVAFHRRPPLPRQDDADPRQSIRGEDVQQKQPPFGFRTFSIDAREVGPRLQSHGGGEPTSATFHHESNYSGEHRNPQGSCLLFPFAGLPVTLSNTMPERTIYTVSELNHAARALLESEVGSVWLRGEISNLTRAPSGHLYFTLKDNASEIAAVRFRSRIPLPGGDALENGVEIITYGRLTIYEPRGRYQFVASLVQLAGLGALQIVFEELKARLHEEGLFDAAHKQPLPRFPHRVGVITSPTGAVLRDIVAVFGRRWPSVEVLLFPSAVQGETAIDDLIGALTLAERFSCTESALDLLIIGRGGGSLEDLAAFNDERVARAVFACPLPIISCVGHEVDFTITDFVADLRAPTPSAAAEMATPDRRELLTQLQTQAQRTVHRLVSLHARRSEALRAALRSRLVRAPREQIERLFQGVDVHLNSLLHTLTSRWNRRAQEHRRLSDVLRLCDPSLPLRRGFSLTYRAGTTTPLRDVASLAVGDAVDTRLLSGTIRSLIEEVRAIDHR